MKRVQDLQQEIYNQALNSGYFRNVQAQLKTYVYDLIEKEYNSGKSKSGFQYEHPLLPKLKNYPLTSLCMDLIQQFLESFKFKHTLNVFKKEINRANAISRASLSEQFKIQIKDPTSKAVLLSLVEQMVSGDIGAIRQNARTNNFVQPKTQPTPIRNNNFMENTQNNKMQNTQPTAKPQNISSNSAFSQNQSSSINSSGLSNILDAQNNSSIQKGEVKIDNSNSNSKPSISQEDSLKTVSQEESQPVQDKNDKKKGKQNKGKPKKEEKEKPPEQATDLLGDVMKKFGGALKNNQKQKQQKQIFAAKRAYSQAKQKKVYDAAESGANKIRGASLGKGMSSLMNKFMPQAQQPPKNQSFIDQQLDQFQQSKDSTRKNPLFSSSQSGFDKSGFDHSVDSNAIQDYEYVERAKKFAKKF